MNEKKNSNLKLFQMNYQGIHDIWADFSLEEAIKNHHSWLKDDCQMRDEEIEKIRAIEIPEKEWHNLKLLPDGDGVEHDGWSILFLQDNKPGFIASTEW